MEKAARGVAARAASPRAEVGENSFDFFLMYKISNFKLFDIFLKNVKSKRNIQIQYCFLRIKFNLIFFPIFNGIDFEIIRSGSTRPRTGSERWKG